MANLNLNNKTRILSKSFSIFGPYTALVPKQAERSVRHTLFCTDVFSIISAKAIYEYIFVLFQICGTAASNWRV